MLKIRDFARLAEVSMSTLRYYDEIGLLKPIQVDPDTGYRFYSVDQLPKLHRILAFKELGLELAQIIEILEEGVSPAVFQGMLRLRQAQIQQRIQAEQEQLVRIEARLRALDQDNTITAYDILLKPIKSLSGVALRLSLTDLHQAHWVDVMSAILQRHGVEPLDHLIVLHPESEGEPDANLVEVVAPVHWKDVNTLISQSDGRLSRCSLPAVERMASTIHPGHPAASFAAYQALGRWMEHNGYTIVGPRRKVSLRRGANLDDALTEIQFPVAKADE